MPVYSKASHRMWSSTLRLTSAVGLSLSLLAALPAYAVPLTAGDTAFTAAGADPEVGGNVIDTKVSPLVAPTFSGSITSKVIDNDPTNPNGLAALTFTYQFSNAGPNALSRFTISSFAGFAADAFYVAGPNVVPWVVDRSLSDDVIGFSYVGTPIGFGKVIAGTSSVKLVIQTNATRYQNTLAAVIDGSTAMPASFAPLTVVPEPSSIALASLGAVGLIGYATRKRRK